MNSEGVNQAVEGVVEELVDDSKLRANSIWEYLSPFGVITIKEFVYRLFFAIGMMILIGLLLAALSALGAETKNQELAATVLGSLYIIGPACFIVLIWFLFATIAKDYRTYGMPIPVIFALLTPVLPFFLVIKFILSSKVERRINQAIALKQRELREHNKQQAKANKILDRD